MAIAEPAAGADVHAASTSALTLDLAGCVQLALRRQPRIAAERASLAAAEAGLRGVENVQAPALLVPELPIRRRQASLGVTAAVAGVEQAEREAVYAVTRTYFTVLYARAQERVAGGVVDRLAGTRDAAKRALDAGARDASAADVSRATIYLRLAEAKRIQASQGVKRAFVALREAIGLGCDVSVDIPDTRLPEASVEPARDQVVAQAMAHRGELVRAGIFVEVACLEVQAQGMSNHRKKMETFAAGSDIHAVQVPQGVTNSEYRPGGVPPEMPTLLAGPTPDRVQRARDLHTRAVAVSESAIHLIVLEAEDAFFRWEEARLAMAKVREAADLGDQVADDLGKNFAAGLRVKAEEVINARVLASQAHAQYNEFLYHQIIALADLERVTGGRFCAHLPELVAAPGRGQPLAAPR